ncbi:adenylate kinase 5, chloroplastic isoform X1 [Vitis riparia]|uniref:adenylate kinase 5, chloroplastic isoform X1 n=1 Tax=Vitis riparia TaxID=96939 RepID=UPI00155A3010|nr:adenylate kinase 5, chloroplastic isoform X1 [Vitis riparia]
MLQSSLAPPSHLHCTNLYSVPSLPPLCSLPLSFSSSSISFGRRRCRRLSFGVHVDTHFSINPEPKGLRVSCAISEPLKVMISGAPASGKGTQCEMIVQKFGLVHISTGDLLRSEVSSGSEIGNKAKEYMDTGRLVPDEVVIMMVTTRISQEDAKEKGWLLDGFPRTFAQAQSLEKLKIRPDVYIVLDVPDQILIDRCVGRRVDPVTGKIYHLKFFPPENEEIKARLVTRSDDTEEKVKSRLEIYKKNAEAILSTYSTIMNKVDGNHSKDEVFKAIDSLLSKVQKDKENMMKLEKSIRASERLSNLASSSQENWRGIPTRLNNIPHSREIRTYFYDDVLQATQRAVNDGRTRLKVEINIPELNPEMDVYRIGTLMELVRVLALSFADDGKHVKVCVQGSMGEGALAGMPLQLAGTRKILEFMDWGDYGAKGTFINIGSIGSKEVEEQDDLFILVAPQNAVGNCIIDDLKAMTDAAGNRPVILVNPRLKDLPGSSGIMQTMGRDKRLEYAASFENCYFFRLLYYAGTQYPIMGAIRMSYPYRYELYKRVDESFGKEKYIILTTSSERPNIDEINDAFIGKPRSEAKKATGFWGFLSGIL